MANYWFILLQFVPILVLLYFYFHKKFNYWSRLGVKGPSPSLLKFGNVTELQAQDPLKVETDLLQKYGKVYGVYTGISPTLTIADPDLVKQVLVKDFHLFVNRRQLSTYHEMTNNGLFFTDSETWKRLRTISSPTFSSGKLRKNVPIMNQCIEKFENYLDKLAQSSDPVMDAKNDVIGMTIEVIAATSFGAQTESNDTRSKKNPFVVQGLKMSDVNPLVALSYFSMPAWFNKMLNVQHVFNVECLDYFTEAVKGLMKQRKHDNKIGLPKRTDLIQLLIDANADESLIKSSSFSNLEASMEQDFKEDVVGKNKTSLTEKEIVGSATGIFLAGFDTTALNISSCLYELSKQPALQERLSAELNQALDGLEAGSDKYMEVVMNGIPYLDAVIKETLRKYPALVRLERRCMADEYKLGGVPLTKNQLVEISVFALHYNPEYYPDPLRFDPERFMPENKHLLVPYTFVPFGDGPRNCMGMRYAYQEIKLCLSRILRQFKFQPTESTPKQIKFLPFKFVLNPEPFKLKVEKRV